jgi:hypothetical protein
MENAACALIGRCHSGQPSSGGAGASAKDEHDRRKAAREAAVRERHPRIGGLLLALREPPVHERRWAHGAEGERRVAEALERRCRSEVVVLHDRRVPGSRANIDHIAVAPSGVWVIDTKRYKGRIEVRKPLLGKPGLRIGGRDRTNLFDGLAKQVAVVEPVVQEVSDVVSVHSALCFVDGELPLFGTRRIHGVPLVGPKGLAKRLNADGPVGIDATVAVARALAEAFGPA